MTLGVKKITGITCLLGIAITTLLILDNISKKKIEQPNGFSRKFLFNHAILNKVHQTEHKYYIAGIDDSNIFYYYRNPKEIMECNLDMQKSQVYPLPVDSMLKGIGSAFRINVFYPVVELYALGWNSIIRFNLLTHQLSRELLPGNYTRIIKISNSSYIVKGFDSSGDNEFLYKINTANSATTNKPALLDRRNDAGLSTDGHILYDNSTNAALFIHLYSNRILYMDSNLNLLATGKTIDTFSDYQLTGRKVNNKNKTFFTQAKPPRYINYTCCVYNHKLYVNSLVKADNESETSFNSNCVIDIYDHNIKKYLGSFYVPKYHNEKLRSFCITDSLLVATYPDAIISYHLN